MLPLDPWGLLGFVETTFTLTGAVVLDGFGSRLGFASLFPIPFPPPCAVPGRVAAKVVPRPEDFSGRGGGIIWVLLPGLFACNQSSTSNVTRFVTYSPGNT